ncbi:uncharacterized protein METZ01_LOCUS108162 [marine metagenome]|uniref:Uncharacterized protein n=1 Tax=marine metagenome TaxID=408172 RepID=A0A381WST2_9ZZZZ
MITPEEKEHDKSSSYSIIVQLTGTEFLIGFESRPAIKHFLKNFSL